MSEENLGGGGGVVSNYSDGLKHTGFLASEERGIKRDDELAIVAQENVENGS